MPCLCRRIYDLSTCTYISLYIDVHNEWPVVILLKNNHGISIPISIEFINEFLGNESVKNFATQGQTVNREFEIGEIKVDFIKNKFFQAIRLVFENSTIVFKRKAALEFYRLEKIIHCVFGDLRRESNEIIRRSEDVSRHVSWISEKRKREGLCVDIVDIINDRRFTKNNRMDLELAIFNENVSV